MGELKNNGLRFYGQYDSGKSTWLSGVGVKCGSIHDPSGKSGMAHAAEHLIFNRSKRYPDPRKIEMIFRKYLGRGADSDRNIGTARHYTFYGHNNLSKSGHMKLIFDIMASFVHPKTRILDEDVLPTEVGVIHNEYCLQGIDIMEMLLDDLMHALMYDKNPARNRVDCNPDDLMKMTIADQRNFIRRYYVPKNMFMIMLGPSFDEVKEAAERYFSDMDSATTPVLDYDHSDDLPNLRGIKSKEVCREGIHQYYCGIGFPTDTYLTLDAEAIDILSSIWEFRLERLRAENRDPEKGVYLANVAAPRSFTHGMIWTYFATVSGEYEKRCEEMIAEEIKKLKTTLVSPEELDMAKYRELTEYYGFFRRNSNGLAEKIIDAVCNGDENLERLHARGENLKKVSRRKLLATANKYFTKGYARVLIKPVFSRP